MVAVFFFPNESSFSFSMVDVYSDLDAYDALFSTHDV